jgi:hypothetical protein
MKVKKPRITKKNMLQPCRDRRRQGARRGRAGGAGAASSSAGEQLGGPASSAASGRGTQKFGSLMASREHLARDLGVL